MLAALHYSEGQNDQLALQAMHTITLPNCQASTDMQALTRHWLATSCI